MSDNNLPAEAGPVDDATPKTIDQAVDGIADLLADPEPDLPDDQAQAKADPDDGDEPEIDVSEDVDADEGDEPDGSQEIKGGRFAPDSAKVTLDDGTVTTVAELKRNNLFQRDYTKKTTELKAEREQVEARRSEVDQQAQSLAQEVEYLNWYSDNYLPKPPTPPSDPNDYVGFIEYQRQKDSFEQAQQVRHYWQQQIAARQQQAQAQAEAEANQAFQAEYRSLVEKDPFFADTGKARAFLEEVVGKGGDWWGITREDIGAIRTAKQFLILRDALRYRKALAKAPEAQKQVQSRPAMIKGSGRRADPRAQASAQRQAKTERLRRDGSFDNAVAALMDLDL